MSDDPGFEIIKLPDLLGDEERAARARQQDEARRRYRDRLVAALAAAAAASDDRVRQAEAVLDSLFVVTPIGGGDPCRCSCHPHLPASDFHDYGFGCSCQQTAEQRRASWAAWRAEMDAYWDSPEGRAATAARQAEEDELRAWLGANPDVAVTSHGGLAPEQWRGTVDGHSFYFRERHDHWRIELDLRPSGRFYRAWSGSGDLDEDDSYEWRETDKGDVIAEGVPGVDGYGRTPVERARFIVGTIRAHLGRSACDVHRAGFDDLELRLGHPVNWCPSCGEQLCGERPTAW